MGMTRGPLPRVPAGPIIEVGDCESDDESRPFEEIMSEPNEFYLFYHYNGDRSWQTCDEDQIEGMRGCADIVAVEKSAYDAKCAEVEKADEFLVDYAKALRTYKRYRKIVNRNFNELSKERFRYKAERDKAVEALKRIEAGTLPGVDMPCELGPLSVNEIARKTLRELGEL